MKKFLATVVLAALASPALAGDWIEIPTAPELLPGQITSGTGSLDRIIGTLSGGLADLYCIRIVDEANFRATTVGGTSVDTQLFLFDANGMGVTHNDDSGSSLQSTITSQFVNSNGIYFLAVSGYNRDPQSAGGLIWNNSPFGVERAPDGPGAAGALASWTGTGGNGDYTIFLTGASYHVPEPSALALLALGGLAIFRRR